MGCSNYRQATSPDSRARPEPRIRCGADQPFTDAQGNRWSADRFFHGGTPVASPSKIDVAGVDGAPGSQGLYRYGREGEDFTCALFDAGGNMIAQAAGLPVHAGGLPIVVRHFLHVFERFEPGDAIIHNDPYTGGSHQADVVICRPMFDGDMLIGFAVNRGHWTDIGGMAPGGWSGTARHVVQEALIIPAVKLYEAGKLKREIREVLVRNVRFSRQMWGDVQAQIASNITAERRLRMLIAKYGLEVVLGSFEAALDYTRRRFLKAMEAMPNITEVSVIKK